jgi:hypothetical protein
MMREGWCGKGSISAVLIFGYFLSRKSNSPPRQLSGLTLIVLLTKPLPANSRTAAPLPMGGNCVVALPADDCFVPRNERGSGFGVMKTEKAFRSNLNAFFISS